MSEQDERRRRILRALARARRYDQHHFVAMFEAMIQALDDETQEEDQ